MILGLRTYKVRAAARKPLIDFMIGALVDAGCTIIHSSPPDRAPFVVAFETPTGERMGIVAYAFLATRTPTRNRPADERSFQIKYGSKEDYADDNEHELWQDPLGMFTTLLVGIDPDRGYCVSADPIVHSPTKFFIRLEFKDEHAKATIQDGWHAWERTKRATPRHGVRVETLIGVTRCNFLDLVRFERAARGLDPGNRLILAERRAPLPIGPVTHGNLSEPEARFVRQHPLVEQFALSADEIFDLISNARRLKMAVKGWVAEEHLRAQLAKLPDVRCERLDDEGGPDLRLAWRGRPPLTIECKNVAREVDRSGLPKLDFQRTRASKGDPCSRYYRPSDFDIVAACLHGATAFWDFRYTLPGELPEHGKCHGRIASNLRIDQKWISDPIEVFARAYAAKDAEA